MYRYRKVSIDTSIYWCIAVYWSMNCFLQWIKLWNWHFIENGCEINLVQYGDSHGFIAIWGNYLIAFSKLIIIYARASNTFKQWYIAISWYFWHDTSIHLEPVSSHLYSWPHIFALSAFHPCWMCMHSTIIPVNYKTKVCLLKYSNNRFWVTHWPLSNQFQLCIKPFKRITSFGCR